MNAPHNIPAALLSDDDDDDFDGAPQERPVEIIDCGGCGCSPDECECPVECTECDDGVIEDIGGDDGCTEVYSFCSCARGTEAEYAADDYALDAQCRRAGVWL